MIVFQIVISTYLQYQVPVSILSDTLNNNNYCVSIEVSFCVYSVTLCFTPWRSSSLYDWIW